METLHHMDSLISLALAEDFSHRGDITSDSIFYDQQASAMIYAKEDLVVCGCPVVEAVFRRIDPSVGITFSLADGDSMSLGQELCTLSGPYGSILKGERLALNFLGHLSGIATETKRHVDALGPHTKTRVLDTRKTIPGYRHLAKYAVRCGGGVNHRMGLYDQVLIKDNHIDGAGSITKALSRVRERFPHEFIEVECRDLEMVVEALEQGVDRILLDNMDDGTMVQAIELRNSINPPTTLEGSGNLDHQRLTSLGSLGLDFVSVGRITHSAPNADFSLRYKLGG